MTAARIDRTEGILLGGLGLFAALVGFLAGADPKLALAAAIGSGFVLLVFADLATGLAVFGFFSFLELLQLGSVISVGKLGGALLALGWLAVVATRYDPRPDFFSSYPGLSLLLGLFLGWSLLSTAWADNTAASIGTSGRFALNVILFLIVYTAIRTKKQALLVTVAFLAGAVAATMYGLLTIDAGQNARFAGRLSGTGLDPNELASALVAGAVLSTAVAANMTRSPGLRIAAYAAGLFCVLGIFFTVSRGGLLALVVAILAALLLSGRWRLRVGVLALLIAVGTFFYFAALAPEADKKRITSSTQGETELEGRTTIWQVGWRMVEANPVKGVGSGNFRYSSKEYLVAPGVLRRSDQILLETPQVAHNTYLGVLAELGVIGMTLFALIIAFSINCALRAARTFRARGDPGGEALARAFAIALIGVLAADFFISQELNKQLWLLLGLGPALLGVARSEGRADPLGT